MLAAGLCAARPARAPRRTAGARASTHRIDMGVGTSARDRPGLYGMRLDVLLAQVLLVPTTGAVAGVRAGPYYMSAYGTNLTAQQGWLTLAQAGGDAYQTSKIVDAFFHDGIPSMIQMPVAGVLTGRWGCPGFHGQKGMGTDLNRSHWEATLTQFAQEEVVPRMKTGAAIGVFVGYVRAFFSRSSKQLQWLTLQHTQG